MHPVGLRPGAVTVQGVRSPTLEAGPPNEREAVVFLHGNPGSSGDWRGLLRATGAFARSVALDLPGFGRADKREDFDYTIEGYVRHVEGALTALGIERCHLVLHDFGAMFGLGYAFRHPDRVRSLVLLNVGVLRGYRWHTAARVWRIPVLGELAMALTTGPAFRLALRRGNPRPLPATFVDEMWRHFDRGTRRAVLRLYRSTDPRELRSLVDAAVETFRERNWPALVIWGKHDPFLSWRYAARQREAFPSAEVHVLAESGHWPYADQPRTVESLVERFLRPLIESRAVATPMPRP